MWGTTMTNDCMTSGAAPEQDGTQSVGTSAGEGDGRVPSPRPSPRGRGGTEKERKRMGNRLNKMQLANRREAVAALAGKGRTQQQIAAELKMSQSTVCRDI